MLLPPRIVTCRPSKLGPLVSLAHAPALLSRADLSRYLFDDDPAGVGLPTQLVHTVCLPARVCSFSRPPAIRPRLAPRYPVCHLSTQVQQARQRRRRRQWLCRGYRRRRTTASAARWAPWARNWTPCSPSLARTMTLSTATRTGTERRTVRPARALRPSAQASCCFSVAVRLGLSVSGGPFSTYAAFPCNTHASSLFYRKCRP